MQKNDGLAGSDIVVGYFNPAHDLFLSGLLSNVQLILPRVRLSI